MQDIIKWLRDIEDLARELYLAASEYFSADPSFSAFLAGLADEETWHFHLMGSALQLSADIEDFPPMAVKIDEETRQRIEEPLRRCYRQLTTTGISRGDFLDSVVQIEFSELNDLVLYVLRTCQGRHKAFQKIASAIQGHRENIETFLKETPGGEEPLLELRKLPAIWKNRYLVVDDEPMTVELLSLLLKKEGEVLTAGNGKEALDLIQQNYFDAIICDVNMPVMTGTELYERAKEFDENLGKRFVLTTGNVTSEINSFCRHHHLRLLPKPYSLFELKELLEAMLEKNARP